MPPDDIISNDVLDAALRLQAFCRSQGWRFCFIGGLAVQKWGEPRVTDDVDLTLLTGLGTEAPFIDALLALNWVEPRIPRAREFAQARRVLLLQTKGGVGIDIAMGRSRSRRRQCDGVKRSRCCRLGPTRATPAGGGGNAARAAGRNRNLWAVTLGDAQYAWLKRTLEGSRARYKFVFAHHVMGRGRGAVEGADFYEWGGQGPRGATTFREQRPTWDLPIHQLMVKTGVTIFF